MTGRVGLTPTLGTSLFFDVYGTFYAGCRNCLNLCWANNKRSDAERFSSNLTRRANRIR
jgi:hypothetical protein